MVYKGDGWLDLSAAELSGPVTTFLAVAYKSTVTILVPPSVRVEMTGFGVTQGLAEEEDPGYHLPADAPVIHVRGIAYKGAVEITTRPPERRALRRRRRPGRSGARAWEDGRRDVDSPRGGAAGRAADRPRAPDAAGLPRLVPGDAPA